MDLLDALVTGIAGPTIRAELGAQAGVAVMAVPGTGFAATIHGAEQVTPERLAPALALFGIRVGLAMAPFSDTFPAAAGRPAGGVNAVRRRPAYPIIVVVIALTRTQAPVATATAGRRQRRGSGAAAVTPPAP